MILLNESRDSVISEHAERDYPYECCGLLIGRFGSDGRKEVLDIYPISNAREDEVKRTRFLIKPEELMRGERAARDRSLDVVGFYHSHPDCPAVPSEYDREHAWPTYSYLVISVRQGEAKEIRSWELESNRSRFCEEEIERQRLEVQV